MENKLERVLKQAGNIAKAAAFAGLAYFASGCNNANTQHINRNKDNYAVKFQYSGNSSPMVDWRTGPMIIDALLEPLAKSYQERQEAEKDPLKKAQYLQKQKEFWERFMRASKGMKVITPEGTKSLYEILHKENVKETEDNQEQYAPKPKSADARIPRIGENYLPDPELED